QSAVVLRKRSKSMFDYARTSTLTVDPECCLLRPLAGYAQDRRDRTLVCSSGDGQRTDCSADVRGGVRMARQLGNVRCDDGYTWGFSEQGVWVDRGCQAEFVLPGMDSSRPREGFTRIETGTVVVVRTDE